MVLSLQERIFLVEHTFRCNGEFTEEVRNRFKAAFPNSDVPHRNSVRSLIAKFRETGSVRDACRSGRDPILTDEKINNISEAMVRSPNKSVRRFVLCNLRFCLFYVSFLLYSINSLGAQLLFEHPVYMGIFLYYIELWVLICLFSCSYLA